MQNCCVFKSAIERVNLVCEFLLKFLAQKSSPSADADDLFSAWAGECTRKSGLNISTHKNDECLLARDGNLSSQITTRTKQSQLDGSQQMSLGNALKITEAEERRKVKSSWKWKPHCCSCCSPFFPFNSLLCAFASTFWWSSLTSSINIRQLDLDSFSCMCCRCCYMF